MPIKRTDVPTGSATRCRRRRIIQRVRSSPSGHLCLAKRGAIGFAGNPEVKICGEHTVVLKKLLWLWGRARPKATRAGGARPLYAGLLPPGGTLAVAGVIMGLRYFIVCEGNAAGGAVQAAQLATCPTKRWRGRERAAPWDHASRLRGIAAGPSCGDGLAARP